VRGIEEVFSVYVVEDDDAVRDSLAALLEPEGFFIKTYSSADRFLNDLDRIPHGRDQGCLLLDLHMPGKSGHELLSVLAVRDCHLPVIVMTGNADDRIKKQLLARGAVAVLGKPADADQLIDTIKAARQKT
jgi:two-component system, LuxR family, response regulator FixJ